jgi:hypothetical protein
MNKDIIVKSATFNIPNCLTKKILSQERVKYSYLFGEKRVKYSDDEYNLMLLGASLAYQSQTLLGRKLPMNHPKAYEVSKFLTSLGVSIQYHPYYGMILVDKGQEMINKEQLIEKMEV